VRFKDLVTETGERQDAIVKWRDRFAESGPRGLLGKSRSAKPAQTFSNPNISVRKQVCCWLPASPGMISRSRTNFLHFPGNATAAQRREEVTVPRRRAGRKVLEGTGFDGITELVVAIETFVERHNEIADLFVWKKRAVKEREYMILSSDLRG
jgi:hypothetical protein